MIWSRLSLSRDLATRAYCTFALSLFLASAAVAAPSCPAEVEVRLVPTPPVARNAAIRRDHDGVRAIWLSAREVVLQPTRPALRIAGSAGLEVILFQPCFLDLPDGYFPALHLRSPAQDIEALGVGICDPADGICHWRDVPRPGR